MQDEAGNDLFIWGPRPKVVQQLVAEMKAANVAYDTLTTEVQNWYNKDKGDELQKELLQSFYKLQLQQDCKKEKQTLNLNI